MSTSNNDWRPMHTAPTDGSSVLVVDEYFDAFSSIQLVYDINIAKFNASTNCWASGYCELIHPVAWMPIPEFDRRQLVWL